MVWCGIIYWARALTEEWGRKESSWIEYLTATLNLPDRMESIELDIQSIKNPTNSTIRQCASLPSLVIILGGHNHTCEANYLSKPHPTDAFTPDSLDACLWLSFFSSYALSLFPLPFLIF